MFWKDAFAIRFPQRQKCERGSGAVHRRGASRATGRLRTTPPPCNAFQESGSPGESKELAISSCDCGGCCRRVFFR